jgi:hypothetical protein
MPDIPDARPTPGPRLGVLQRGAVAGLAGGAVLAAWFLLVDGLSGRPFHTPAFLFRVLVGSDSVSLVGAQVALYTVVHFAAFLLVGIGAAWLLERLQIVPGLLLGAVLGFLLFDLVFYLGITLTGVDVVGYLGWAEVLAGNFLAGIVVIGTVRLLGPEPEVTWGTVLAEHQVLREGVVVGLIGAVVVAGWFLLIDIVAGRILFTPAALGSVIFHGATGEAAVQMDAVTILGYTGLHLAAFFFTGLLAAAVVALAEDRHPYILLGGVLLFVTFETFFVGVLTIVAQWLLDVIPWWSIAVGNLLAAVAMGYYLWTRHPRLAVALGDEELERNVGRSERPARPTPGAGGSTAAGPDRP